MEGICKKAEVKENRTIVPDPRWGYCEDTDDCTSHVPGDAEKEPGELANLHNKSNGQALLGPGSEALTLLSI